MSARALAVEANGKPVGVLRESDDLWEFEYAADWAKSPEGFSLSPGLPRESLRHVDGASQRPVQWYFDNLLPEDALRTIIAKEANLPSQDAFGLLAYFGAESAGSLALLDPDGNNAALRGLKPLALVELSRRIKDLPRVSLTRDAPKRMSLAGAQHKMLVVLRGNEIFEPLPGTPSTFILKPEHQGEDYPASVINEYFTMRLAGAVGLDVPEVRRLYVPEPVYMVQRFDREGDGEEVHRRHVIDTCQLLNKSRSFKYTSADLDSLGQAIELCRSKARARIQLYRWVVFNLLAGNSDNHLKNISFLVDSTGINLAPAYDLLCTAAYETRAMADEGARWPQTQLAFSLGNAMTFGDVTRAHVLAAGKGLGLADATAIRELDRLVRAVPAAADRLIGEIEADSAARVDASPDPAQSGLHVQGEQRLLRVVRTIILAEMAQRLA